MISTSDIINKLIKDNGYKTFNRFCTKNGICPVVFATQYKKNCWTKQMLDKVGKALSVDLSKFVNAYVGVANGGK